MISVDAVSDGGEGDYTIELPGTLADGASILVVGPIEPAEHALCLRLLGQYGAAGDTSLVVTTTASASETVDAWDEVAPAGDRPSIGVVDTTSEEQSIAATYGDVPTVFTPSSGDLERIVMAISELTGPSPPPGPSRHLAFRSLTPILHAAPTDRVCHVLDRTSGLRTGGGLGLLGVDVTAHSRTTLAKVAGAVDGVVWIERATDGNFRCEFHPKREHVPF